MNIEEVHKEIKTWDTQSMAQLISLVRKEMYDKSKTKVSNSVVKSYVKDTLLEAISSGKLKDYPEDFSTASRSTAYRGDIQLAIKEAALLLDIQHNSGLLQIAWENCEKSRTLVDFRKNLRMYIAVLKDETYSPSDIKWYVDTIDALEEQVKEMQELKRQNNAVFEVYEKDDEEVATMLKYRKLKLEGLKDVEVLVILGLNKDRLKYLKKKHVFEE